ncbi:MurR/RpiR family transcriptional regulator [Bacillus sp. FJAT-47783]|uniref:MurR/RpiR family transcriptional regulator n=1 Tax=Bacillus sp. FJAT-47783 TaxID=2922712 RepID=UPI001FAC6C5E|nr:MurR/RpiR family transcriptional regulator [Bacillus sp. FJAT-47783]
MKDENVFEKIRKNYNELTNRQKPVAKFILDEPKQVALHPAKKIGELTSTSETTVIRLCYALGYSGYTSLQNDIRYSLLNEKEDPLEKLKNITGDLKDVDHLVKNVIEDDVSYIQQTLQKLDMSSYHKSIKAMIEAKNIIVVGFRSSYASAHWLAYTLNIIKGNVHLFRGEMEDANYLINRVNEDYLIIALSFPRYTESTIRFVSAAKLKGAKVLAITDDELSPIGPLADLLLKVVTATPTTLKGMPVIFSLLNLLVAGVSATDKANVQQRIHEYNQTSRQLDSIK